jgi:hypothetical protein
LIEGNRSPFGEGENAEHGFMERFIAEGLANTVWPAPEMLAEMESLVEEIAHRDYPDVWVGQAGMTAAQLLELQKSNEEWPEEFRLWPGQVVRAEGTEGGIGMPEVGGTRLSGLDVVMHLKEEMDPDAYSELYDEVLRIGLARQGKVLMTFPGEDQPGTWLIPTTVDRVPAVLAEELKWELVFYAQGGMGFPYVIPETEKVKEFLAEHGEYFG